MRLLLASDLKSRDGSLDKDAGSSNAVIEAYGDSSAVRKRPGSLSAGTVEAGSAQLLACYNGELKSIIGNTLADLIVVDTFPSSMFEYPTPATGGWSNSAYGLSMFVMISRTGGQPATSADGVNWTLHPAIDTTGLSAGNWVDITFGGGLFVAIHGEIDCDIFTSPDGINWTYNGASLVNDFGIADFCKIRYVNGFFYVLPDSQSGIGAMGRASDPTVSVWDVPFGDPGFPPGLYDFCDIVFFSGKYYVLAKNQGDNNKIIMSSVDGLTFGSPVAPVSGIRNSGIYERLSVIYGKIAVTGVSYSSDGVTWNLAVGLLDGCWTYSDSTTGLVGGKSYILTEPDLGGQQILFSSVDGITWEFVGLAPSSGVFFGSAFNGTDILASGFASDNVLAISQSGGLAGVSVTVESTTPIVSIDPTLSFFAEVSSQAQSQNVIVFKTSKEAWTYDGANLVKITDADYPGWSTVTPVSITRSGGVATITFSAPVNWQSGSEIIVAGADQTEYNGTHIFTVVDPASGTFPVTGTPVSPATGTITIVGGRTTVPGIVFMDGYFFVMDANGVIYNSTLGDATSWNALDFLTAQVEPGSGIALAKSQSYIIALKAWSTEFFYDAGNPIGSPLSPVISGFTMIGCASGDSVANIDGTIAWVSKTRQKGRSVHVMEALQQKKVSTPDIERILNSSDLSDVYSYGIKTSGHVFYVLGLIDLNLTLVYDFTSGTWGSWSSLTEQTAAACAISISAGNATVTMAAHGVSDGDPVKISGATPVEVNGVKQGFVTSADSFYFKTTSPDGVVTGTITAAKYEKSYFKYTKYAYCSGRDLVLHETTGELCEVIESAYSDAGSPIEMVIRTTKIDGDGVTRKTNPRTEVIGNKSGSVAALRWSDDDYSTDSKFRPLDLSAKRSRLLRCGSFRRRSYELRHVGESLVQISSLELDVN